MLTVLTDTTRRGFMCGSHVFIVVRSPVCAFCSHLEDVACVWSTALLVFIAVW